MPGNLPYLTEPSVECTPDIVDDSEDYGSMMMMMMMMMMMITPAIVTIHVK
jgi:hypothetical protein